MTNVELADRLAVLQASGVAHVEFDECDRLRLVTFGSQPIKRTWVDAGPPVTEDDGLTPEQREEDLLFASAAGYVRHQDRKPEHVEVDS